MGIFDFIQNLKKESEPEILSSTYMFVSLNNGAGCKTIASQVALALAQGEKDIVGIFDGDFFMPVMSSVMNTTIGKEDSILNYFNAGKEINECIIESKEAKNIKLVSASPVDKPVELLNVDREMVEDLYDYLKKTFDYFIICIPYLPLCEWFVYGLSYVDKGYLVWDEQPTNAVKTRIVLDFVNSVSDKANSINNIIINKRTKYGFPYEEIDKIECNYITEFPFVEELDRLRKEGKQYVKQSAIDNNFKEGLNELMENMLLSEIIGEDEYSETNGKDVQSDSEEEKDYFEDDDEDKEGDI